MRIKLAFDLWCSLFTSDQTAILPKSEYVKLFINNEFQGLYLLAEKQDRRLFGLDDAQNNLNSSLLLQASEIYFHFKDIGHWEQDYPNEEDGIYIADQIIEELTDFINNSPDTEFFNDDRGIFSKFYKTNLIDFYLFNNFIFHGDFWSHNYYLARNTMPSKFFLIPWDFDYCFGTRHWMKFDANLTFSFNNSNYLFERLVGNNDFMREVQNRWADLRANLWTDGYIFGSITNMYNQIHKILEIDLEMWRAINLDGTINQGLNYLNNNEKYDFSEEVPFLYDWITRRLDFCDDYFAIN